MCPTVDPLVALTATFPRLQKPYPDSFVANRSGRALLLASVTSPLLEAQSLQIAVIYHLDGHVYGRIPNIGESQDCNRSSFGIDAMRQFLIIQRTIREHADIEPTHAADQCHDSREVNREPPPPRAQLTCTTKVLV